MKEEFAFDSSYLKFDINESITIYDGSFVLREETKIISVNGIIKIEFLPKPRLTFSGTIPEDQKLLFNIDDDFFNNDNLLISVPSMKETSVWITRLSYGSNGNKIEGFLSKTLESQQTYVNKVIFHVVNFLDDLGRIVNHGRFSYRGRIELQYKEWDITLDKRYDFSKKDFFNRLKSNGYAITHIGCIQRRDNSNFNTDEIQSILKSLHWLLSFAAGRHVGISILEGLHDSNIIWSKYQTPIIGNWTNKLSWFPRQRSIFLERLFPCVMEKHEDILWNKVLWEVLSWYIEIQSEAILENKIVSVQVALEMLAWVYLIEDGNSDLTRTKFKNSSAAEKIRTLLNYFSIDISIPGAISKLTSEYNDGPHLFTTLRNDIVHPLRKPKFKNPNLKFQILQLGIWYLELVILAILEYKGEYRNRLKLPSWDGAYDLVPWR